MKLRASIYEKGTHWTREAITGLIGKTLTVEGSEATITDAKMLYDGFLSIELELEHPANWHLFTSQIKPGEVSIGN